MEVRPALSKCDLDGLLHLDLLHLDQADPHTHLESVLHHSPCELVYVVGLLNNGNGLQPAEVNPVLDNMEGSLGVHERSSACCLRHLPRQTFLSWSSCPPPQQKAMGKIRAPLVRMSK